MSIKPVSTYAELSMGKTKAKAGISLSQKTNQSLKKLTIFEDISSD